MMALTKKPGKVTSFPRGKKPLTKNSDESGPPNVQPNPKEKEENLFQTDRKTQFKAQKKGKKKNYKVVEDDQVFKLNSVDPLTYAQLDEGMILLGCISQVSECDLKVSLPGNLVGTVPISNISEPYTKVR